MDIPRYDFHIHTKYLKCADETMEIKAIVETCETLGITKLAITDHLDDFESAEKHLLIAEDIAKLETNVGVYFGVELDYLGYDGQFAYNEEIKERIGYQFAIGGIHDLYVDEYDLKKIIDIQHMHHLKTCKNPLVSVLVHPFWLSLTPFVHNNWPIVNPLKSLPESHIKELAQVARDTGTAIEMSANSCLLKNFGEDFPKYYEEYVGMLAAEGAVFSFGSDAHNIGTLKNIEVCFDVSKKLGLDEKQIWQPDFKPINSKK
jgi:histidinol phosphatase-like PHP family hydrolase